jgi:hypothetical protein
VQTSVSVVPKVLHFVCYSGYRICASSRHVGAEIASFPPKNPHPFPDLNRTRCSYDVRSKWIASCTHFAANPPSHPIDDVVGAEMLLSLAGEPLLDSNLLLFFFFFFFSFLETIGF